MLILSTNTFTQQFDTTSGFSSASEPGRMGPNALPVPRMSNGHIERQWVLKIACDYSYDRKGDTTINPYLYLNFPINRNAAFSVFTEPFEFYRTSEEMRLFRAGENKNGISPGDLYFLTSIQILSEKKWPADLMFDLLLKTTTGKNLNDARHINAPAYFFELTAGKEVYSNQNINFHISGLISFIAWQVRANKQNDAPGFGILAEVNRHNMQLRFSLEGYSGWINNGDKPLVTRLRLAKGIFKGNSLTAEYQLGIRDQPTHRVQFGYQIDLGSFFHYNDTEK